MSDGFRRFLPGLTLALFSLACGQAAGPKMGAVEADGGDDRGRDSGSAAAADAAGPGVIKPDAGPVAPDADGKDLAGGGDLATTGDLAVAKPDVPGAPAAILIYTRATGYVHASKGPKAMAIKKALAPLGIEATISEDPALFTTDKLSAFAGVVLVDSTDRPLGDPGTAAIEALVAFVRGGRGLVGIHAASSAYENAPAFVSLIGGHFREHPGGVRQGRCQPEGTHPAAVKLPATLSLMDEFYVFDNYRADNIVDLRCDALNGGAKLPIAWHRQEGQGRVFYSALGHDANEFEVKRVLDDHLMPGLLWAIGRSP